MNWLEISLGQLKEAPWNYKKDDESLALKLKDRIRTRGQIVNLIVREIGDGFFEVVNGNHRMKAMLELGRAQAMCFNLGEVDLDTAKLVALETNELEFKPDEHKLGILLKDLRETHDLPALEAVLPFKLQYIQDLSEAVGFNWDHSFKHKEPPADSEKFETIKISLPITIAEQWKQQLARIKKLLGKDEAASDVLAIEAICQSLHQCPDSDFQ